jgi:hypothetical protein
LALLSSAFAKALAEILMEECTRIAWKNDRRKKEKALNGEYKVQALIRDK